MVAMFQMRIPITGFAAVSLMTQSEVDLKVLERVAIGHERELEPAEAQARS